MTGLPDNRFMRRLCTSPIPLVPSILNFVSIAVVAHAAATPPWRLHSPFSNTAYCTHNFPTHPTVPTTHPAPPSPLPRAFLQACLKIGSWVDLPTARPSNKFSTGLPENRFMGRLPPPLPGALPTRCDLPA